MSIDVENLIGRTPLGADVYQTFRQQEPQGADRFDMRQEFVASTIQPPEIVMQRAVPPQAPPPPTGANGKKRFGALRTVMLGGENLSSAAVETKSTPAVRVIGAGGGTGVTTILATLARTLSKNGECAVIVETDSNSVLSYHFGLTEKRDIQGLQIAPTAGGHPVFLLQRPTCTAAGDTWLAQCLSPLESTGYRILMDESVETSADELRDILSLVVLTPDLGSVRRLDDILMSLQDRPALFVLNKFDGSVGLHEQIREWMMQRIGDRLVTIGRTDAIAESLAEGSTILDYASTSPVIADFENLLRAINLATATGAGA